MGIKVLCKPQYIYILFYSYKIYAESTGQALTICTLHWPKVNWFYIIYLQMWDFWIECLLFHYTFSAKWKQDPWFKKVWWGFRPCLHFRNPKCIWYLITQVISERPHVWRTQTVKHKVTNWQTAGLAAPHHIS